MENLLILRRKARKNHDREVLFCRSGDSSILRRKESSITRSGTTKSIVRSFEHDMPPPHNRPLKKKKKCLSQLLCSITQNCEKLPASYISVKLQECRATYHRNLFVNPITSRRSVHNRRPTCVPSSFAPAVTTSVFPAKPSADHSRFESHAPTNLSLVARARPSTLTSMILLQRPKMYYTWHGARTFVCMFESHISYCGTPLTWH